MITRRFFIGAGAGFAASGAIAAESALDAVELGLLPDAPDDQSARFQNAVDQAAVQGLALFLTGGVYRISDVSLPDGTNLIGAAKRPVLQLNTGENILNGLGAGDIHLQGIELRGNGGANPNEDTGLLHLVNCTRINVTDCNFSKSATQGVNLIGCSGRVNGCLANDIYGAAIASGNGAGMWFEDNLISDCGNLGIYVVRDEPGFDGTIIARNQITGIDWKEGGNGQNGNGINVFRAGNVVISDNVISDCTFSAVRLNATTDCQITGNNCTNCAEVAIFSEFGFSGSIVSDNIIDQAAQGISITNFNDGGRLAVCSNNIVRNIWPNSPTNPDTTPVGIAVEADAAISGNVVENVPGVGILLGWGPYLRDLSMTGNVVRGCAIGVGVSVVEGVDNVLINANLVQIDAGQIAFAGMEWDAVTEPEMMKNAADYPKVTFAGNRISGG